MFCPKCSQQQVSDETRFCSRCGFQLGVVKALLVADGLPLTQEAGAQKADRSLRKRDLTIGAMLMFFAALLVFAITVDLPPSHSARIIFLIIVWLLLSVLINIVPLVRYLFHGDSSSTASNDSLSNVVSGLIQKPGAASRNALPPAQSIPATNFGGQRLKTAEVVEPPSVTERTTNLLSNE
ncbi:MAG TPA: zinc ribbon domain-containing protein [Pyrinomonadaceae bacterium]|nr:zinc ribbon domain-containing protein [Pyrinomonadaceae bacterium]